ncbi:MULTISPECIES: class I SAM-dependent methyltransferase [Nocardiopsis]|uniref:Methyltransferase n=1 Tax=Nocardiopsis sinuspersici TaxID=501010 RepID=A0A1V3C0K5_9ACTN|nr:MULTISPECIES: class I SAM-dependent methyltransferase [Nocardiopsis]OOC54009.1 methyltransferase [Nocardiopsis sinuspersici]
MSDNPYDCPAVAALYDTLNPWGACDDFYLDLVMGASRVLDVGCGTGHLLHRAREHGHTGTLVGVDPAQAMLEVARARTDITWTHGDLSTHAWEGEFDLVTMTGHAFQELRTDTEATAALTAMRRALAPGALAAFETRNPAARAWQRWTTDHPQHATTPQGVPITDVNDATPPTPEGSVSFTSTTTSPAWDTPLLTHSTLRFMDAHHLDRLLRRAGLGAVERFGGWDRSPLTPDSPEIITLARAI